MRLLFGAAPAWLLIASALGEGELTGFPANPYDPYCAMACLWFLSLLMVDCSGGGEILAWCMKTKCEEFDILVSKLERFWETDATGQASAGVENVPAKWSYAETLTHINTPPTFLLAATDHDLNQTSLVNEQVYTMRWNVLTGVQEEVTRENGMGIAMLVAGFGTPIVLTIMGHVPGISTVFRKLKPYLVWPSAVGTYQVRPLPYLLGNAPTVGQSLYIAMFVILNVYFVAVNYVVKQPNAWYAIQWREIMAYVLYRTGVYPYIMAPLIFLFAGRNNILLWLTNWSHSTFLLLHRWVARVFRLQAILHSILAVIVYKDDGTYDMQVTMPCWIWGIRAIHPYAYEFFLIKHIVLSVILLVACWYHAYDLYTFLGGYHIWLYCTFALWFLDRLGRVARIVIVGLRRATVTELSDSYVRIDIPGVRWGSEPGKQVYVYFPTLHPLRPWENHPFSVPSTPLLHLPPPRIITPSDSHRGSSSSSDSQTPPPTTSTDPE
ncbi:hypothetical protein C8A00DRAFT_34320, partial [Chaetomidium leptoderma]